MKFEFNKKYATISLYAIITFAICLLMVVIVQKFSIIAALFGKIAEVLAPVTWGVVIAYLANPIMMWFERLFKKLVEKKKPHSRLTRSLSVAVSITILIAIITALIAILLPEVIDSIMDIANNFKYYIQNIETRLTKLFKDYPVIYTQIQSALNSIQPKIVETANSIIPKLADMALRLKDSALVIVIGLKDFIIGFFVAVYLLLGKERFIAQLRKVVTAIFPAEAAKTVFNISSHTNRTIGGFISGKLIDSFIIGVLCFISMTIMNMDFVALISVVVGVTNVIPFFGPFIGAIPSAFLLLVAAPKQVIPFIIFIFILQQFDGNILGPKILGDSTGLSSFWVMFAIFLGGGLFGFAGMLLGVPIFAVIYSLVKEFMDFLLNKKGLSSNTDDYLEPVFSKSSADNSTEPKITYFLKKNKNTETNDLTQTENKD